MWWVDLFFVSNKNFLSKTTVPSNLIACRLQFYEEITRKLLVTLLNVQDQRNELIDTVKRKDVEINQYKIEGANLMRS